MAVPNAERQRQFRERRKAERENMLATVEELAEQLAAVEPDLKAEDWASLAGMPADDLRNWVRIGRAMARRGDDDAPRNAIRWVEGN